MKKIFSAFIALIMLLSFSGCGWKVEIVDPREETAELEKNEPTISVSEPEENTESQKEPEIFSASLIVDPETPFSEIKSPEDFSGLKVVSLKETEMTGKTLEIWEKYITPLEKTLLGEFDENNLPKNGCATYTYIFYSCEYLDYTHYGIEKSGCDMSENYLVDGRRVEESLGRWFPWNPEDYRQFFDYNPETDEYQICGCGGGPTFTYITDYRQEDDLLTIEFALYDGWSESGYAEVYSCHEVKIRLEENGWKYLSSKIKYESKIYSPQWHNDDYSAFASYSTPKPEQEYVGNYLIGNGNKYYDIKINDPRGHKMYFGEKPYCFFLSLSGLYFYRFETGEFVHISEVPSEYDLPHFIKNVWVDNNGNIILSYAVLEDHPDNSIVEIAVLEGEKYEVINYINTGFSANYFDDMPFDAVHEIIEDGTVEIYDVETESYKNIKYLE